MKKNDLRKIEKVINLTKEILNKGWTKGAWARDKRGNAVDSDSPNACSWCLLGAIILAEETVRLGAYPAARLNLALTDIVKRDDTVQWGITGYNDREDVTLPDVLSSLDQALARVKAEFEDLAEPDEPGNSNGPSN